MRIVFYGDSLTEGSPGVSFMSILKKRLPELDLENHGKGGDTVASLLQRIVRHQLNESVDLAFVWVGVNDVFPKVSFAHSMLKHILRQPRAKSHAAFRNDYDRVLRLLRRSARCVVTVSPLVIGEDLSNPWNQELAGLCEIIASVSSCYTDVRYLDLRTRFSGELAGKTLSDFVAKSLVTIARDTVLLRSPLRVDSAASDRGLHFTLDGVHLNSAGAEIVAAAFLETIETLA